MDEGRWLSCSSPGPMLDFLHDSGASARKLRLFAAACCRRLWPLLRDDRSRTAVEVAERFADGLADREEFLGAWRAAEQVCDATARYAGRAYHLAALAACGAAADDFRARSFRVSENAAEATGNRNAEYRAQVALLLEIFGSPFLTLQTDPSWLTANVLDLARTIYDERAFDRLPILADALMDAGCNDETMLDHCRGDGPHARGCWVVDLILNKN